MKCCVAMKTTIASVSVKKASIPHRTVKRGVSESTGPEFSGDSFNFVFILNLSQNVTFMPV